MVGTRMVLLDEPLQGLAPVLAEQYVQSIGRLRRLRPDLSVVITESNASLLVGMPDQTWLLERSALCFEWRMGPFERHRPRPTDAQTQSTGH